MGKREPTETGKAIQSIMELKGFGTNSLADAMGKTPNVVCERIYMKNISVEKLAETIRVMGYKIMLVPRGTKGKDFFDVGSDLK